MKRNFWSEDRGDSTMMTAIFCFVLLLGVAYALSYSTGFAAKSSRATSESNRMVAAAESALSHAVWSMNNDPTKTVGSGTLNDGSDVTWSWSKAAGATPTAMTIKSVGKLGDRTVTREAKLVANQTVGAEKIGDELRYVAGAKMASAYVLAGSEVTAMKASWATAGAYLSGKVGIFDGVEKPKAKFSGSPSGGVEAFTKVDSSTNAGTITNSGAAMILSSNLVKKNVETCSTSGSWKSSQHGSKIAGGSTVCADVVTIDSDTTITGTGLATIKAKKLVFRGDITTTASNQLRAWVDGNVEFDLGSAGADKALQVDNTHIYAGAGSCRTLNVSTGLGVKFSGSMACKRIDAIGSFTATAARTISETTYPLWVVKGE